MALVSDPHSMLTTIKRLHAINDGVTFWNEEKSFKLLLRNDPHDADTLACELCILTDDDDEVMARVLDLSTDGYVDEPGVFVLDSWSFEARYFGKEEAGKVMSALNAAYWSKVCPCASYLIKDDALVCVFCQMTLTQADRHPEYCSICCENGVRRHMKRRPCCSHYLHAACLATWKLTSGDERCPLCRAA